MSQIKDIKLMSSTAMALQASTFFVERFLEIGGAKLDNKKWLGYSLKAIEKANGVFNAMGFLKTDEARKLADGYWETGSLMYQLCTNLAMLPAERCEEFMQLVAELATPLMEQADMAEQQYAKAHNILEPINLASELKARNFTTNDEVIFNLNTLRINLLGGTMEVWSGTEKVFSGQQPQTEYQLDLIIKMVG